MLDYSAVEFLFTEFPKGVDVTMFDNKGKKTLSMPITVSLLKAQTSLTCSAT
jgi:hypothetical protein